MLQHIYAADYGMEAWDTSLMLRCYASLLNAEQYQDVTAAPADALTNRSRLR